MHLLLVGSRGGWMLRHRDGPRRLKTCIRADDLCTAQGKCCQFSSVLFLLLPAVSAGFSLRHVEATIYC
jgi:hypothetical protein